MKNQKLNMKGLKRHEGHEEKNIKILKTED